jgi:hypothetical protein
MTLEIENEKIEIANTGADICDIRRQGRIVIAWVRQPRPLGAGVSLQSNAPNPATTVNIRGMTGPRAFSQAEIGPYLDFGEPQNHVREIYRSETYKAETGEWKHRLVIDEVFDVIGAGTRKEPTLSGYLAEHRRHEYNGHPQTRAAHDDLLRTRSLRFVKQNPNIVHEGDRLLCGSLEMPTKQVKNQWEKNLKKFGLDKKSLRGTLGNTKVREEVITGPDTTQHVVPSREVYALRLKYNPGNSSLSEVAEEITEHPDYSTDAARYAVRVTNTPVADLGFDANPNTIVKRFSRLRHPKLDFTKVAGHWFCVVVLNGRPEIKKLARIETPFLQVCKIFLQKMRKSKLAAAKKERRKPNKAGLDRRIKEASDRIQTAYAESFIFNGDLSRFTQEDQNNWSLFKGFKVEWGTDVTNSSIDRGQLNGE